MMDCTNAGLSQDERLGLRLHHYQHFEICDHPGETFSVRHVARAFVGRIPGQLGKSIRRI